MWKILRRLCENPMDEQTNKQVDLMSDEEYREFQADFREWRRETEMRVRRLEAAVEVLQRERADSEQNNA